MYYVCDRNIELPDRSSPDFPCAPNTVTLFTVYISNVAISAWSIFQTEQSNHPIGHEKPCPGAGDAISERRALADCQPFEV